MVLTSKAQANLVGGVSQQPDALRLDNQCRVQDNAYGTLLEGLKKRYPTKFVKNLGAGSNNYADASYHWINRDPGEQYLLGVVPDGANTRVKAWDILGNPVIVNDTSAGLFGSYFTHTSKDQFKWVTINDYTFLLNTYQTVSLNAAQSPAQDKKLGFVYVRQGNYKVNYSVTLKTASSTQTVAVATWNGTAAGTARKKWRFTITAAGAAGSVWTFSALGFTRTSTNGSPAPSTTAVAQALTAAINTTGAGDSVDDYVTATWSSGNNYFDVEADVNELNFTPTLTNNGAGTSTRTDISLNEYASIKTDDIASELASKVNALGGGWGATTSGSVIKIIHNSVDILSITTKDSVGDTALKGYFLTVDNFDELPPRALDATVLRVQGSVETAEDDFYVKFVTKTAGDFNEGEWRETIAPERQYELENMPLVLIRSIDDAVGTITGTPFGIYFSLEEFQWGQCLVGDANSNPPPSFVASKITDIFFHKNRLGVLTEGSIVLSEAGIYGNFWRTTIRQLLDADPIDIQASHTSVAKLQYATPLSERLVVFSETAQFILSGDPLLTPKTASFQFVSAYAADMGCKPVSAGRNVYYVANKGGYGSVWEYSQILENVTSGSYQSSNISTQVPQYISQGVKSIATNTTEEVFVVRSSASPGTLYIWKYFVNGNQMIQSAWSRFTFQQQILSVEFYENTLYMVTKLGTGASANYCLETMEIGFGTSPVNPVTDPLLDRSLLLDVASGATFSYNGGTNLTTVTLPTGYSYFASWSSVVVVTPNGTVLTPTRLNDTQFTITGQYNDGSDLIIGSNYTMTYEFGRVDIREETPNGGRFAVTTGRYQNLYGILKYSKTKTFTVTTQIQNETVRIMPFEASLGNDETGTVKLDNGEFRFPTLSKTQNLKVQILNSTPFPCTILGAEWIANFTTNFQRIRQ